MKVILITVCSGVLLLGAAAAQDSATPATGSPASDPQTTAPQTQPQSPASQTPARQSSSEPSPQQPPQAQTPGTGATSPATGARRVAPGSVIPVLLTKTIDAKKAKSGDEVVAKVTQDLKTNSGEVLVSKDTKILGHVTVSQAHSKEQKESQLGIMFDRAVEKNGNEMQLPMSIQAIIGPENNASPGNSGGGANETPSASSTSGSTAAPSANAGGRSAGMGGATQSTTSSPSTGGASNTSTDAPASAHAPITGQTAGVVGIANLKLESAGQTNQGSVVSSDKNNVKLESGTMMLLRVNQ